MFIAFIILGSIILIISVIHFNEYVRYKFNADLVAGIIYFLLVCFSVYCSINAYKEVSTKNKYQAVVYDKFVSINRRIAPYILVKVNNTYTKVKIDNLYVIDKIQIGDTITVVGYDEKHLRLQ